jgi:uncharacterized protein (TIGR03118 family)
VTVPAPGGAGTSHPTGIVFNNKSPDFPVAPGKPASFIFATEDGTISAWNSSVDATHAVIVVDRSGAGAVYKGLAIATSANGSTLYAANFNAGTVDVFDANFNPASSAGFQDPMIPAGFAPFNIQTFGNKLYVTFAKQDAAKHNDVPGPGNGYVDVFGVDGSLFQRLGAGGPLNSPWGIAIAPANFGDFGGNVLIGNFGDGTINAFNATSSAWNGALADVSGKTITIPGLWGLQFGNGGSGGDANALYFAAGIPGPTGPVQSHGLFGSLQSAPLINPNGVVNGATFQLGISPYTFASIMGTNLASTTRIWQSADFVNGKLPTTLDGVSVMVDGKPAYVYFVSPKQLNILLPNSLGPGQVQTFNNGLSSATFASQVVPFAPALFLFGATGYIAATHANGAPVGPAVLFPNSSTPAKPGETVSLYGTGFGATNPVFPDGVVITSAYPLVALPTVTIGGVNANVTFAGLTGAGLYQINVTIPQLDNQDAVVMMQYGSIPVATGNLTVQSQ